MTPEELIASIKEQMAEIKAALDEITQLKEDLAGNNEALTKAKEEIDSLEQKHADLEESLKALQKPADPEPLGAVGENGDPKCGFKTMSEQMHAVWLQATKGKIDPRLEAIEKMQREKRQKAAGTGLEAYDAQYGGALLAEEFRKEIWMRAQEETVILQKVTTIPINSNMLTIPALGGYDESSGQYYGGVYFLTEGENDTINETRPAFEQLKFTLGMTAAFTSVSHPMMTFSPNSVGPMVEKLYGSALALYIEDKLLNGTGAGEPDGAINADCVVEQAKETGQTADTVNYYNIINMKARCNRKRNAVWMYNKDVGPQLDQLALTIGTGGEMISKQSVLEVDDFETEYCQKLGDAGDIIIVEWPEMIVTVPSGQAEGGQFDTSIHFHFDTAQNSFRWIFYWDGKFAWRSAKTPRYSSSTLSPVVKLAERA